MKNLAIKLKDISKKYIIHHQKPTLAESFFKKKEEFWALRNISLEIEKGEKIGIIGRNGSGKTTLLKIISGITTPTGGDLETQGRIASLIELTAGFHPDLTGEENIYLNGLLLGLSRKQIKNKFKKIVNFSELDQFIDAPFYTYSGGMMMRLGFSVAVHANPDILIVDEILSVGDKLFQEKCQKKIKDFFKEKTVLFVSHNLEAIKSFCPQTFLLEGGEIKVFGKTDLVIKKYLSVKN